MAENLRKLKKTDPYYNDIVKFIRKKVTLKKKEIILVLDFFVFFMKKEIIEKRKLAIHNFGIFYVKKFSRNYSLKFKISKFSQKFFNDEPSDLELLTFLLNDSLKEIFLNIRKYMKLKKINVNFLFELFLKGIYLELLKNHKIVIRNFGIFYVYRMNYTKDQLYGKPRKIINYNRMKFKPKHRFSREINYLEDEISALLRVSRLLKINKINTKIPVKK